MSRQDALVLFEEHALLGASFEECDGDLPSRVLDYCGESLATLPDDGAALCDLSGSCYLLAGGAYATGLAPAAFAGEEPRVGECEFSACLTGDGSVVGVPLLLRTGDDELVVLDASLRSGIVEGWLSFLSSVEVRGEKPYAGATLEDAHGTLVPLLLAGPAAERVLLDYVSDGASLPAAGSVSQLLLDRIGTLVAHVPAEKDLASCYVVFVPAPLARVLWRSLLSFTEVVPIGHKDLDRLVVRHLPWGPLVGSDGQIVASYQHLVDWGLVRGDDSFVGARALRSQG